MVFPKNMSFCGFKKILRVFVQKRRVNGGSGGLEVSLRRAFLPPFSACPFISIKYYFMTS